MHNPWTMLFRKQTTSVSYVEPSMLSLYFSKASFKWATDISVSDSQHERDSIELFLHKFAYCYL